MYFVVLPFIQMSSGISANDGNMRSNADSLYNTNSDPCSTITPDRDDRRDQNSGIHGYTMEATEAVKYNETVCRYVSSSHQPNIIENEHYPLERDNLQSLSSRTKSQDTVRSGNDIIDVGATTPKLPTDCGDDVKLVSPPKIGKRTGEAVNIFGSWSSPPSTGALDSPIPYNGRKEEDQAEISKNKALPYGIFQYPPSSPVSSSRQNVVCDKDIGRPFPLQSEGHYYPFSNLPTAFRTKSWGSEVARNLTQQSSGADLMKNNSFEVPPYRFSGLGTIGTIFTPQMSLNPNFSAPLSITDSFESEYPNYNSRGFSVPSKNVFPFPGGRSDDRFTHRPFHVFNDPGTAFRQNFQVQDTKGDGRIISHQQNHWPSATAPNIGYSTSLNQNGSYNFLANQVTSNNGVEEVPECAKSMSDSPKNKKSAKNTTCVSPHSSKVVRTKPSRAAQAAIAAGMTMPSAAHEVLFDILNPPLTPVLPPSTRPVCSVLYDMNPNDVLLGRGGGTNNQLGNQRFRTLVQQFQPTYLLSKRKDKPLIARSVVLIVRKRGGRFLRKDEDTAMLYEVGDEKAEAKTSQALREGLDVRANRSSLSTPKTAKSSNPHSHPVNSLSDHRDNCSAPDSFGGTLRKDKSTKQDSMYYHHLYKSGFVPNGFVEGDGSAYGSNRPLHTYPPPYYSPYAYVHPTKLLNGHGPSGRHAFPGALSGTQSSYGPGRSILGTDFQSNYFRDT